MSSVCPCKDCPNKGCGVYHSKCEKYLKWKEEYQKDMEYLRKLKQGEHLYFNS